MFAHLPAELPRVVSVGRLDLNSEGLLLLTNDGTLARALELPSLGWIRRYKVRVHGTPDPARLASLARGVTIGGISYGPIRAVMEKQQGSNAWLTISLGEGKNREVRRVMEHLDLGVTRLIRLAYGPFQLGKNAGPPGQIVERGVGGVAAIAMVLGPAPAGLVLGGQAQAGLFQPLGRGDAALVKPGDKQFFRHPVLLFQPG